MKNIRLENFRCYANQTVNFKPGINLLIGDNASGKTSLLKACKYVLSAFFSGYSDENTRWISPDIDDFRQEIKGGVILSKDTLKIEFTTDAGIIGTLQKNSKKNSKVLARGISEYKKIAREMQTKTNMQPLRVFANFSVEDIHPTCKRKKSKFTNPALNRSFGYYECLNSDGFLPCWNERLLALKEASLSLDEIKIVRDALIKALGAGGCNIIKDVQIYIKQKKIYYILTNDREVETDFLSDGYRRLINIVTDIAFRCALLNKIVYKLEACSKTKGTVLIDEIDLHIDTKSQATVLKGLQNVFPQVQFIVTTHAPMVMTGVESNKANNVCKLCYSPKEGYTVNETQTYGMDISTITEVVLKQVPRDEKVDRDLSMLFEYIDENKTEEALALLKKMKDQFGDNLPELAQAEVMINSIAISNAKD